MAFLISYRFSPLLTTFWLNDAKFFDLCLSCNSWSVPILNFILLNGLWFYIGETKWGTSSRQKEDLFPLPQCTPTPFSLNGSLSLDWAILFRAQFSFFPPLQLFTCCCERCSPLEVRFIYFCHWWQRKLKFYLFKRVSLEKILWAAKVLKSITLGQPLNPFFSVCSSLAQHLIYILKTYCT